MAWLFFQAAHIGPMLGQLGFFKVFSKEKIPMAIERFEKESLRVLGVLETRLGASAYLGSGEYGLADIMTFPWVRSARARLGVDFSAMPNVVRWLDEIEARPAVQRGLAIPKPAA